MSIVRARSLERWLKGLVLAYQDPAVRPRDRTYSNLTRMAVPTQVGAISMKHGVGYVAAIILSHTTDSENAVARAVRVSDLRELADFSQSADEFFQTNSLQRSVPSLGIHLPEIGVAEQAAMSLADAVRREPTPLSPGTFSAGMKQAFQVEPPAAFWLARYRPPLPGHRSALLGLEPRRRRAARPAAARARPLPAQAVSDQRPVAYAAYSEPIIWFGEPPFPSVPERILGQLWYPTHSERLVHHAPVGDTETFVYNTGLILAATADRSAALSTVNQVFAALTRSGVLSLAAPDYELVDISSFDPVTGEIRGSRSALTQRNRLLDMPRAERSTGLSWALPEEVVAQVLSLADTCSRDQGLARQSLRLNSAVTLLQRGVHTEAFVNAWTLVETALQREFRAFWTAQGRSKRAIDEMDWTASQMIDLLIAVGKLPATLGRRVHKLRKRRNVIVHDLQEAANQETIDCIDVAAQINALPELAERLQPCRVLL